MSDRKQRKLTKVKRRIAADSDANVKLLRQMLTPAVDKSVLPPKAVPGRKWTMVDSGSQPNVADCPKEFPDHPVRPIDGSKSGLHYKGADGSLIPNRGEVDVTHVEPDGETYEFTFQDAPVHCPILSVKYLVTRDCTVTFHKHGGHILYPSGKKVHFVCQDGVFFVALNLLPPNCKDVFGRPVPQPDQGFVRQGP